MKQIILALLFLSVFSCTKIEGIQSSSKDEQSIKSTIVPDHIVFVWFENKDYSQIIGGTDAPYIQSLIARGTLFSNSHANFHPSKPNYISFFAGDNLGITTDACTNKDSLLIVPNLYTIMKANNKRFTWYSEDMPKEGYHGCQSGLYKQKHNPAACFDNVPKAGNKILDSLNLDTLFDAFPKVACITPNLDNDMHNGTIAQGDAWLQSHFSKYIEWAMTHNSILVVYFDENDGTNDGNLIPVIAVGQNVRAGHTDTMYYDHYNWTKTLATWYGLDSNWTTNLQNRTSVKF